MGAQEKICEVCSKGFTVYPEDLAMYEKIGIPPSEKCPPCRLRHLFSFWAFGRFRKAKSALSGKAIITVIPETVPYPIYSRDEWFSDAWDSLDYGQEYDPKRSFFEQFDELQARVPHPHQLGTKNTGCEWCDDAWSSKNCYLTRSFLNCEDMSYGYRLINCNRSLDLAYSFDMEFSYDCVFCFKSYNLKYSFNCRDCIQSSFLYDCRNCQNCFLSWNLKNKEYHILNKPYSKEEYEEKLKEYDTRSWTGVQHLKKEFKDIIAREAIHRENFNFQVTNCTGNFLTECKNCFSCGFAEKSENCRYVWRAFEAKDCIDCTAVGGEHSALAMLGFPTYNTIAASYSTNCRYSQYLDQCEDCEYCFGCVGMRKKKYCILNKQYTKESFENLKTKIISRMKEAGEWGTFFPLKLARFGYNLSSAQIYFPSTKEEALAFGSRWQDIPDETHEGMDATELPDRIDDVPDDIVAQPLVCPETKLRYNIAPHELAFYRERGIPLPRRHFDWRILNRFRPLAEAVHPREGVCVFCRKQVVHYYPPKWGYEKIACIECYQREIV